MAEIKWNPDAIRQAVQEGINNNVVPKMQAVLDSVLASERSKDVEVVKATLATRWHQDLGLTASDEFLQRMAEQFAAGKRVVLSPGELPPINL
jgi:hypothetical protein